jgi:hypothetical protein
LGRALIPADAHEGRPAQPVSVLSYTFWQRHFNASRDLLGKTLELQHQRYSIVGVWPQRFSWTGADVVYLPLQIPYDPHNVLGFSVTLKPGVNLPAATAEFQVLFEQFAKENPARYPAVFRIRVDRLTDRYGETLPHTLYILFGAVVLLLAIGCANASVLLSARGASRRHELSIRAAIGASRSRIIRQLLTESLVLSLSGAFAGLLLAYGALPLIVKWLPAGSFPREAAIAINVPVLAFSVALALATSILFGLSPALQLSQPDTRRRGAGRWRTHTVLIAGQIALTLLLLTAAGGAAEGFLRLMHTNLGYDPHNTMDVGIPVHIGSRPTWQARGIFRSA